MRPRCPRIGRYGAGGGNIPVREYHIWHGSGAWLAGNASPISERL